MKTKKCRVCPKKFEPFNSLQVVCGPKCALKLVKKKNNAKAKAEKKRTKLKIQSLKTYSQKANEVQVLFNRWIKLRDANLPCVSCNRFHGGKYDAGHFYTVKARPELRFNIWNVHKQCQPCNRHLSGNLLEYRRLLIERIGAEKVNYLEGHHELKRYTDDDLNRMKKILRKKIKSLESK